MKKTFKIFTLGCKVNQYDSQQIREHYLRQGYKESAGEEDEPADLYIINTCTVTAQADKKSRYYIHYAHRLNPHADIVVTGCYAVSDKEELQQLPGVSAAQSFRQSGKKGISSFAGHTRAFLKIQDGCENFCSYCKIPLVRGKPISKEPQDIVTEAQTLVKNGFKEIVLCGICLGSYGRDLQQKTDLVDIVTRLEQIHGLKRIRLSSIEAWYVSDALLKKMAGYSKLCPHLHIPLQSGDDEILYQMNRPLKQADYLRIVKRAREMVTNLAITTDVLVGYPGETDNQFQNTIAVIKEIHSLRTHIFPFSPRPGTKAHTAPHRISSSIITRRTNILRKAAAESAFHYKKRFLHKILPVLFESTLKESAGDWEGYTANYLKVRVKSAKITVNLLREVQLTELCPEYFTGVL